MLKKRNFILNFLYYAIIMILIYIFFRYIIYMIMPFLIGFVIAFVLRPIYHSISSITKIPEKIISFIIILLFYTTIGSLLIFLSIKAFWFLKDFLINLPNLYTQKIDPFITNAISDIKLSVLSSDIHLYEALRQGLLSLNQQFSTSLNSFSVSMINTLAIWASSLPNLIVSLIFTIISTFFFALDFNFIIRFFKYQLNANGRKFLFHLKRYTIDSIVDFFIAYGKLMILTFFELVIGLSYLKVEHCIIISFLIALFDFVPVLGTGGIMFPWIVFQLISGNTKLAVGLLILQLVITLIHNIVEPKIVGNQIGIHPLIMLFCMYMGGKFFGILGIILMPIVLQVIQNLNNHDIIHIYRKDFR